MSKPFLIAMSVGLAACAARKEPAPKPTPVTTAVAIADQAAAQAPPGASTVTTVHFVEAPDDVFVDLVVAAAGWAKRGLSARSIGVYQPQGEPRFTRAVEAVTNRHAFRPISQEDFTVVCGNAPGRASSSSPVAQCSMKYVEAVLSFNSVRIAGDSGYVGLNVTRVPNGSNRSERVFHCVTLGRKGASWEAKRSERMVDYTQCPRS